MTTAVFGRFFRRLRQRRGLRLLLGCAAAGVLLAAGAAGALLLYADRAVSARLDRVYTSVEEVPPHDCALVLGTVKTLGNGRWNNAYFTHRIRAAAELYHAGRVRTLIVSGDNSRAGYDEPSDMREALIAAGVPDPAIRSDFAGFRTLDSVIRARNVFGVRSLVIVSQPAHCARALYLADAAGLEAVGYAADEVVARRPRLKQSLRECAARAKAVLDTKILHTKPHFEY